MSSKGDWKSKGNRSNGSSGNKSQGGKHSDCCSKGSHESGGNKSNGSRGSKCCHKSSDSKCSHKSSGSKCCHKSSDHKSSDSKCCHKSSDHKSSHKSNGSSGSKDRSCGKNDHVHCILKKIGVGTANIRIHFDGTTRTGVFLGISDGCVVINVKGVVSYVKISSITAVDVGFHMKKKRKFKCKKA